MMTRIQDIAIQLAIQSHKSVAAMNKAYSQLIPMLDIEHEMIRTSSLVELEQLTITKNGLGEEISQAHEEILRHWEKARSLCKAEELETQRGSLSDLRNFLAFLGEHVTFSDFERGIFNKAAEQLNKVHDQLAETRKKSLPKIEMNHYLTQKLLHQHQASHRFWQELARAASSTYTAEGVVAKSQDATSVFRAKA